MPLRYLEIEEVESRHQHDTSRLLGEFARESFRLQASLEEAYYMGDRAKLARVCQQFSTKLRFLCSGALAELSDELRGSALEGSDFELKDHLLRFRGCLRYFRMEIEDTVGKT